MKRYSVNMNDQSRKMADLTGIAAGWLSQDPIFKIGCEICEFEAGGLLTPKMLNVYGNAAENRVENNIWNVFRRDAEICKCPHLARYDFYQSNPEKIDAAHD